MKNLYYVFTLFIIVFSTLSYASKQILGRIENVIIPSKHLMLKAKLDTGSFMSSLSAQNIKVFKQGNQTFVQFTIVLTPQQEKILVEPLLGYTHILLRQEESEEQPIGKGIKKYAIRPYIALPICVGNKKSIIKVNLVDRRHFRYPMLLGTDALKSLDAVIDVKQSHPVKTQCE